MLDKKRGIEELKVAKTVNRDNIKINTNNPVLVALAILGEYFLFTYFNIDLYATQYRVISATIKNSCKKIGVLF
jgi:hypothetical protein